MNTNQSTSTLTDVLQEKINKTLDEAQSKINPLIDRIESEGKLLNDFIAPIGKNSGIKFDSNGSVKMQIKAGGDLYDEYSIHPHAVYQLGEKLINDGNASTYLRNMASSPEQWKRDLVADILNNHSKNASHRTRVLIREISGEVRGVLSDQYRRLNSNLIFESFIKSSIENGARIVDAHASDLKSFIEVINPQLVNIPLSSGSITSMVFGARISNSDFGAGALELRAFMMKAICLNGLVTKSNIREIHLGMKLPDDLKLSERTYLYDTKTQASLVKDITTNLFLPQSIQKQALIVQELEKTEIDIDQEVKRLHKAGVLKSETEEMKQLFMKNDPSDGVEGKPSLWKLAQGISAVARTKEAGRKRELEELSGKLFDRIKTSDLSLVSNN